MEEQLAQGIAERGFACWDHFLSAKEVDTLRGLLEEQRQQEKLRQAGVGDQNRRQLDLKVRGDLIQWLESGDGEEHPVLQLFFLRLQQLMQALNAKLFLSLKDWECHFTWYPPSRHYARHLDQFKDRNNRKLSFVCYLNAHWQAHEGGALLLWDAQDQPHRFWPEAGRLMVFRSDQIWHAVEATHRDRYSLTGWFRDRPVSLFLH